MGRKGLDETSILREAVLLIAEEGMDRFSLRGLARRLHVRSASLYNHFSSLEDLMAQVARFVIDEMNRTLCRAVAGKRREAAVAALFHAYRDYVRSNPEVYRVVIALPAAKGSGVLAAAAQVTLPVDRVLEGYTLRSEDLVHAQRYLRSLIHGFTSLESRGYLVHRLPPTDESFLVLVECAADQLRRMEEGAHGHA